MDGEGKEGEKEVEKNKLLFHVPLLDSIQASFVVNHEKDEEAEHKYAYRMSFSPCSSDVSTLYHHTPPPQPPSSVVFIMMMMMNILAEKYCAFFPLLLLMGFEVYYSVYFPTGK